MRAILLQIIKVLVLIFISVYAWNTFGLISLIIIYPVVIYIHLNLFAIGHEAIHKNISTKKWVNDGIAKYFCFFPLFISYSKYRKLHLLHHKYLGTNLDPDYALYSGYNRNFWGYLKTQLFNIISLKNVIFSLRSYTDFFELTKKNINTLNYKRDTVQLIFYWFVMISLTFIFNQLTNFFIIWLIPVIIFPSVLDFYTKLQHAPFKINVNESRTIKKTIFTTILFPMNINMHDSHHQYPARSWKNQEDKKQTPLYNTLKEIFK